MPVFSDDRLGPLDISEELNRYERKLRKVLHERLWEILESVELIGKGRGDPNRTVVVRIQGVKEFRFRFASPKKEGSGQLVDSSAGEGTRQLQKGGHLAGTEPGEKEYDEYEIDRSLLRDMLFERWQLPPPLEREIGPLVRRKERRLSGLKKKGVPSHLAKRATSRERLERLFQESTNNEAEKILEEWANLPFTEKDLRYWKFEKEEEGTKAVQYCLRDVSGSMSGVKEEMCRVLFTYICAYRERRFPEFEARYIVHTTEAEEESELEFFFKRRSSSGGTLMSSSLKLMLEMISRYHSPDEWNIYGLYVSDGENQENDNQLVVSLIEKILDVSRLFVYIEIPTILGSTSSLYRQLEALSKRRRNLVVAQVVLGYTPTEARRVLNTIFEREWEVEQDEMR